jgi:hypothetical protein
MEFRLPLYHQSHVFKPEGEIQTTEQLGRETVRLTVLFTNMTDRELNAVAQYVKDLKFLKDEV